MGDVKTIKTIVFDFDKLGKLIEDLKNVIILRWVVKTY